MGVKCLLPLRLWDYFLWSQTVKNEVNIPVLKNFVDKLYQKTFDQCSKRKHALDTFPLITCLLCVSTKEFFLNKWYIFLEKWCFQELKVRVTLKFKRQIFNEKNKNIWCCYCHISKGHLWSDDHHLLGSLFKKPLSILCRSTESH